jgi:hypothetical protein
MVGNVAWLITVVAGVFATPLSAAEMHPPSPLELVQTIPLPDVRGRITTLPSTRTRDAFSSLRSATIASKS